VDTPLQTVDTKLQLRMSVPMLVCASVYAIGGLKDTPTRAVLHSSRSLEVVEAAGWSTHSPLLRTQGAVH